MIGKEKIVEVLHRVYSELCKSTHTATTDDMDHITALKLLPMYEPQKTKEYRAMLEIILDTYLGFFLANHKDIVNDMYRCNEDLFYDILSKNVIRSVMNC